MQHITLTHTEKDISVLGPEGELGFILGEAGDYEAWANLAPKDDFARALVEPFKTLEEAVSFITEYGVA